MSSSDEQDIAELYDEDAMGDEGPITEDRAGSDDLVHGIIGSPDQLGNDDIAELVASEYPADGPQSPEEAAMHTEEH